MKKVTEATDGYIPGICNIGKEEVRRRRNGAIMSVVLIFITVFLIQWFQLNRYWRLVIFIPSASLVISFEQWYFKFCVAFGLKGVFNFGELGKTVSIENNEHLMKDRAKAIQRIVAGVLIGAIIAVIYFLLPV